MVMNYLNKEQNDIIGTVRRKIRSLNHPLRQKILSTIKKYDNELKVTEIYTRLRIEQSVASQHLAILRKEGFVDTRRDGKVIFYSVNDEVIQDFLESLKVLY